ncbi:MFS transporter [Chroococcus sp. FPU101]|uniref:MFS transporter n=1 Tax=Chroococcus sp. FPU101 TaxID=1974212 RepID=UPI001A904193|nr:MFS transporter [Chroococcus sp. FPU101]GFE67729.1 Major Facilitator Superfamily (MFS) transporter [Chroococcus sp. FPU101]
MGIYLLATQHWEPASIGAVMSISGIAGVLAQTPAGLLVDAVRQKRLLIIIAAGLIAIACPMMVLIPKFSTVVTGQVLIGIAATVFPPAIAAITLGMVGYRNLDRRMGRNESFNHTGNVLAAALAGLFGHFIGREWIFYLVAAMAVGSAIASLRIREQDIDHELARGAVVAEKSEAFKTTPHQSGFLMLWRDRRLLIFSISVILFHFANAAMLPLVGQYLAVGKATGASLYMSACIIVAQLVMIPVASLSGRLAGSWGHKTIFLIAFFVLPIRGVLYTLSNNPYFLVSIQILDGIGAGIFGVVSVIIVAELTKGTGRFNFVQGAIATAIGIGASLSNLMTGFIVQQAGYKTGFLTLAGIAAIAFLVFSLAMPETRPKREKA